MKNLIYGLATLFLISCADRETEEVFNEIGNDELETRFVSFEQKQKAENNGEQDRYEDVGNIIDFRYAAKKATPGVVHIKSTYAPKSPQIQGWENLPPEWRDLFGDDLRDWGNPYNFPNQNAGSGVIISSDGYIVTNNHVIDEASEIEVTLFDNRTYTARVIGTDPSTDLALLKIEEKNLSFIEFGSSDDLEVGMWVVAVGNPFNLSSTVTSGIVSAKTRNIHLLQDQSAIESFIQTDAAVNPGNSGGALVDLNGRLLGINTAIATPTGTYAGYSFAVPVDITRKVVDDLLNYGVVQRGYLGVVIRDMNAQLAETLNVDITRGVYIDSIITGSAADEANLEENDIIVSIDDTDVNNAAKLQELIGRKRPGDKVDIRVIRKGKTLNIEAVLKNQEGTTAVVVKEDITLMQVLGIEVADLSDNELKQFNIESGIRVKSIGSGKIMRETNMQPGFIITRIDKEPVESTAAFKNKINNKTGGVLLEGIYPGIPGVYYYAFGLES